MNGKKAKAIRKELAKKGINWREKRNMYRFIKKGVT